MPAASGSELGKYAAKLEQGVSKGKAPDDTIHHLGDDTGDAITEAYRSGGPDAAADVIDEYLTAYNAVRRSYSQPDLDAASAVKNFGWAFKSKQLDGVQQDEVRQEFLRRHP